MFIICWGGKTLWHFHIEMRRGFKGACWCGRNRVKNRLKNTYNVQQINGSSNIISTIAGILCYIWLVWFFCSFLFCCNEHLVRTKFQTIAIRFNGQISHTLNPNFIVYFFKDCNKVLSTHSTNVTLSSSR